MSNQNIDCLTKLFHQALDKSIISKSSMVHHGNGEEVVSIDYHFVNQVLDEEDLHKNMKSGRVFG